MKRDVFIREATEKYSTKYDFSLLPDEMKAKEKVPIICPIHGKFYKDFQHFVKRGSECPLCSKRKRYTVEEFRNACAELPHTSEYTFEKTEYKRNDEKVIVTCHHLNENGKEHGDFYITPSHLKAGEGCPKCRYIKSANGRRRSFDEIVKISSEVHNGKYDYSLIKEYKNDRIKYPIICPEHGVFYQTFNNHIKGKQGCPVCGRERCDSSRILTAEEFIERAIAVHGNKYDYSNTEYISSRDYITITCPTHGEFKQVARNHLFGQGCPKCFFEKSSIERELFDFVKELLPNKEIIENDRKILDGKEIDVFVPALKIGFEMNGLIWHSEKFEDEKDYHLNKTKLAYSKGIRLIQIFEDEWNNKKSICKNRIKNILGLSDKKIYARQCEIREIDSKTAKLFVSENHLQGWTPSKIKLGAFYNNELVSVMTFGKPRINVSLKKGDGSFELIRFCTKGGISVVGIAGKFLNFFIKEYSPQEITSFADRRWSNGNLYEKIGFVKVSETQPSYCYIIDKKRINRFSLRKDILISKYNCPKELTEKQFCENNGWYRIYDCGTLKYVWKKEK